MNITLYEILSSIAIISSILVITTTSPVISVLYLISLFICIASYLLLLGISFIGISYIVVYVGAIAILILFVIIILNIRISELNNIGTAYTQNIPVSIIIIICILTQLFIIYPFNTLYIYFDNIFGTINNYTNIINKNLITFKNNIYDYEYSSIYSVYNNIIPDYIISTTINIQVETIGIILYSIIPIWIILISIILLLAIVSPIVLSRD